MIPTNKKDVVGDGKVRERLGCTDLEMMEFKTQREGNKAKSRITALDFSRADFVLFRDLLGRVPQKSAVGRKGFQESLLFFRDHIQAQEWLTPMTRISSKGGRRPAWMNKKLLTKISKVNRM